MINKYLLDVLQPVWNLGKCCDLHGIWDNSLVVKSEQFIVSSAETCAELLGLLMHDLVGKCASWVVVLSFLYKLYAMCFQLYFSSVDNPQNDVQMVQFAEYDIKIALSEECIMKNNKSIRVISDINNKFC